LLFIIACTNENKEEVNNDKKQKKSVADSIAEQIELENNQLSLQDSINAVKEDSLIKVQQIQDSITLVEKKKKEKLKVIIDGKVYYKRNKNDYQLNGKYTFRTKDEMTDYDIRKDGTLPSGYNAGIEDEHLEGEKK
jgi:hypothetical protein